MKKTPDMSSQQQLFEATFERLTTRLIHEVPDLSVEQVKRLNIIMTEEMWAYLAGCIYAYGLIFESSMKTEVDKKEARRITQKLLKAHAELKR